MSRIIRCRLGASAVVLALTAPAVALGASANGVTPTSPKAGASVAGGKPVTFKGKLRGAGAVYVHVCKSRRKSGDGTICSTEAIGRAKTTGGRFTYRQRVYGYDAYWLNSPGTYYWQAHRISCEDGNADDCRQEGPVVRFRVR